MGMLAGIIIAIVLLLLAFKFLKSLVKGIVIIALIVLIIFFVRNYYAQNFSLEQLPSLFTTQLQEQKPQSAEQVLNEIVEKLKGMDKQQIEAYLEKAKTKLQEYGLTIESVKKALANSDS
ncbi:MAG: hypothetical protein GX091_06905 [Peptococcaceae bacterium]|nr:hypothetical protein [Peptococcaceae bacterium]